MLFFFRYLNNFNDLELNIKNSIFELNEAKHGGAIYIDDNKNNENNKHYLNFENVNFTMNNVDFFGGAIYSNYEGLRNLITKNVIFKENTAGVAGGALYTLNNPEKYLFNYDGCEFISNNALSHGNDYATNPYLVKLYKWSINNNKIKSGSYFPIEFSFFDRFNNSINDPYKYYSDILVKVSLQNSNIKEIPYKLSGNVCSLINGIIFKKILYKRI